MRWWMHRRLKSTKLHWFQSSPEFPSAFAEPRLVARIVASVRRTVAPGASTTPWGSFRTPGFIPRSAPTLTHRTGKCINGTHANRGSRSRQIAGPLIDFQPVKLVPFAFPSNNFKHFLTLFSKFFASFPHGTCSLSVSRQYLVLDGIYHPLEAALPSNPTLRKCIVQPRTPSLIRDSHPL